MSETRSDFDGIIRVMPETLANKIAAGEVVQRPASVVKELVENALDAGADRIQVVVSAAGRERIQVVDDGCGMSRTDAELCFQRHATSKIGSLEDLDRIRTLGFRGEALASIASVARVELKTRRLEDDVATKILVEGGKVIGVEPCAAPAGTSVSVRQLFYNVPARRNFMKSPATELKHCIEAVQSLALANPGVSFSLVHDEHEVVRLASVSSDMEGFRTRIGALFADDSYGELVAVGETTSYLSIRGFVGRPSNARRSPGEQFLFVNGRFVRNRYLSHAVRSAFENTLPEGTYPFFALFLELDPGHVDVNVHPTKSEVKFDDERGVYGFVRAVVKKALGAASAIPHLDAGQEMTAFIPSVLRSLDGGHSETAGHRAGPSPVPRAPRTTLPGGWAETLYGPSAPAQRESEYARLDRSRGEDAVRFWQIEDRYVLTTIRSGLLIVDQTAAHRRILYEKGLATLDSGKALAQQLLFPQTLEFAPGDFELLLELMDHLRALGFDVEEFGGRTVIVRGIPAEIRESGSRHVLEEILEEYRQTASGSGLTTHENLARSVARRGAVSPGTRLSPPEMQSLIDQLFLCETPFACPDGRPTLIKISVDELAHRFGRG